MTEGPNFKWLGIKGVPLRQLLQKMLTVSLRCFVLNQVGYSSVLFLLSDDGDRVKQEDFHLEAPRRSSLHKSSDRWALVTCTHCYHSRMHALLNSSHYSRLCFCVYAYEICDNKGMRVSTSFFLYICCLWTSFVPLYRIE